MKARSRCLLLLVAPLLGACAIETTPLATPARGAVPLPLEVQARFDYRVVEPVALVERWEDDDARVADGTLKVRVDGDAQDTPVEFELWRSRHAGPRAPAVVVTPILGGGEALARSNCRTFVEAGFHVALVWRGTKVMRRSWAPEDIEVHLRRGVAARRAVLAWLGEQPEVDPGRLCAFGISMGGIMTSVLVAVEPRVHSAVIALAGGDLGTLIRDSDEGKLVRFREAQAAVRGLAGDRLVARLRQAVVSDPGLVARHVDPRRVLLVSARFDEVVPPHNQDLLWRAFGRPLRYDLPTGHYLGIAYLHYVMDAAVLWLQRRLATGALPPPAPAASAPEAAAPAPGPEQPAAAAASGPP